MYIGESFLIFTASLKQSISTKIWTPKKKKNLHECQAIHEIIYINENLYLKSLLFCDLLIHHYLYTEESAYRVLTDEAPDGGHIAGIPKIIKAYELHKDNAEVVASIVSLVMELAEYGKNILIKENINKFLWHTCMFYL